MKLHMYNENISIASLQNKMWWPKTIFRGIRSIEELSLSIFLAYLS